jgi:hypothetical protein
VNCLHVRIGCVRSLFQLDVRFGLVQSTSRISWFLKTSWPDISDIVTEWGERKNIRP